MNAIQPASNTRAAPRGGERWYSVRIIADLTGVEPRAIKAYERAGLIEPRFTRDGQGGYTDADVERVRQIQRLSRDLNLNLAAIEVVLHMRERMVAMHAEIAALRRKLGAE